MCKIVFAPVFILLSVLTLKAERILIREKYNLIIASDTVCAGEDYDMTVDLKGNKNAAVYRNGCPVPMSDGKGYVKFKAAAFSYDVKGMCKIHLPISVVIGKDSLSENITYVVVKPPMSNNLRRVQDSLTMLLLRQEGYKEIPYVSNYDRYFNGFAYKLGNGLLKGELGELLVLVVIDASGKVLKYDIVKNTYKTIPVEEITKVIRAYQLKKDFVYDGNMKFSAVIYTVKGYRGNIIFSSEH